MSTFKHLDWVDSWKGILIFLVVMGHVAGALFHYVGPDPALSQAYVYKAIYLFHMPAFFVVAGYMARGADGFSGFGQFLKKRAVRLLVPYAVWGLVSACVYIALSRIIEPMIASDAYYSSAKFQVPVWRPFVSLLHGGGWPNGEGFRCNSVLWFLPCMFVTLVVHRLLAPLIATRGRLIGAMIACLSVGGAMRIYNISGWPWEISRIPTLLGFMYFGQILKWVDFTPPKFIAPLLAIGYVAAVSLYPDLIMLSRSWMWYGVAVVYAVTGSVITMQLAKGFSPRWLQALGVASLGIMLVHKFILMALQLGFGKLTGCPTAVAVAMDFGVSIVVVAVSMIAVLIIRRYMPKVLGERRR